MPTYKISGEVLTSTEQLETQWSSPDVNLFYRPSSGELYVQSFPVGGLDDDPSRVRMFSLWIPTGFHFEPTYQLLPSDPSNPDSIKISKKITPFDTLTSGDALKVRDILLRVLPANSTIDIATEPGKEGYMVTPKPLGYVINAFGNVKRRNCGQVARKLATGVYYVDPVGTVKVTGDVVFDVLAGTQALLAELQQPE